EPLLGEGAERLDLAGGAEDDDGDDALAPALVGHADDGDLADRRVLAERLLDLEGGDLVAAALQDVDRGAPEEADVSGLVALGDVAGLEPAGGREGGGGRLGALVVAGEDAGAAQPELGGAALRRHAALVDELDLDGGERRPDVPELAPRGLERVRQRDAALGHAEA